MSLIHNYFMFFVEFVKRRQRQNDRCQLSVKTLLLRGCASTMKKWDTVMSHTKT